MEFLKIQKRVRIKLKKLLWLKEKNVRIVKQLCMHNQKKKNQKVLMLYMCVETEIVIIQKKHLKAINYGKNNNI